MILSSSVPVSINGIPPNIVSLMFTGVNEKQIFKAGEVSKLFYIASGMALMRSARGDSSNATRYAAVTLMKMYMDANIKVSGHRFKELAEKSIQRYNSGAAGAARMLAATSLRIIAKSLMFKTIVDDMVDRVGKSTTYGAGWLIKETRRDLRRYCCVCGKSCRSGHSIENRCVINSNCNRTVCTTCLFSCIYLRSTIKYCCAEIGSNGHMYMLSHDIKEKCCSCGLTLTGVIRSAGDAHKHVLKWCETCEIYGTKIVFGCSGFKTIRIRCSECDEKCFTCGRFDITLTKCYCCEIIYCRDCFPKKQYVCCVGPFGHAVLHKLNKCNDGCKGRCNKCVHNECSTISQ